MYGRVILDHFSNPRNVGELDGPDAAGEASNPSDGDRVRLHLRIRKGRIEDVRMRVMGCVAAIASASFFTEWIKGMEVREALSISKEALAERMGGLPEHKVRCSMTCVDALAKAVSAADLPAESTRPSA
jgi:nitrogen fixation NifU-like protein